MMMKIIKKNRIFAKKITLWKEFMTKMRILSPWMVKPNCILLDQNTVDFIKGILRDIGEWSELNTQIRRHEITLRFTPEEVQVLENLGKTGNLEMGFEVYNL